jgi:hypothetical protein
MRRFNSYHPSEFEEVVLQAFTPAPQPIQVQLRGPGYQPSILKTFVAGAIMGYGLAYLQMGITCLITLRF